MHNSLLNFHSVFLDTLYINSEIFLYSLISSTVLVYKVLEMTSPLTSEWIDSIYNYQNFAHISLDAGI
jgi:hypothetical protein